VKSAKGEKGKMSEDKIRSANISVNYMELLSDLFTDVMSQILNPPEFKELCGAEITMVQIIAMRYIYRHGGGTTITALSEGLSITLPASTKLVDRLQKHQWVTRQVDENDHRISFVQLTETGRATVEKIKEVRSNKLSQILSLMSAEDRRSLLSGLESFISTALVGQEMIESICQRCGTDSIDDCIVNQTHVKQAPDGIRFHGK
jgi:DNA-binding MarR family transcriptional regulator